MFWIFNAKNFLRATENPNKMYLLVALFPFSQMFTILTELKGSLAALNLHKLSAADVSRRFSDRDKKCLQLGKTEKFSLSEWIYSLQSAKNEEKLQQIENQSMSWTCVWKAENSIFLHNRLEISSSSDFSSCSKLLFENAKRFAIKCFLSWSFFSLRALVTRFRVLSHKLGWHVSTNVYWQSPCQRSWFEFWVRLWKLGSQNPICLGIVHLGKISLSGYQILWDCSEA